MRSAADLSGSWTKATAASSRPSPWTVLLVFLAVTVTISVVLGSAAEGLLGWDFRFAYLPAADAVLHGHSPYPGLHDPILEDQKGYVYPPQLVLLLLPLVPLPVGVVGALATLVMLVLVAATLRLLDVDDVRCYAAAYLWVPVVSGELLANVSIPLAFALAVVWRYRERLWPPALALGLTVSAKLLLWPMFVWMLVSRRLRASALAVALGLSVTLVSWAAIGFDGLTEYPSLLRRLSDIQSDRSYSIVGMASTAGLPDSVGRALALLVGGALLAGCVLFVRRRDDARAFTCAVAATLALSPIVWLHYLVVFLVPVAILRPRFSGVWLLPVLLWVSPRPGYAEGWQTFVPAIGAAALVALLLRKKEPEDVARPAEAAA